MNTPAELSLLAPILALVTSGFIIWLLLHRSNLLPDRPNERSLHTKAIPRTGGIAISGSIVFVWLSSIHQYRLLAVTAAMIAIISLVDDWKGLKPLPRFSAHVLLAAYATYSGIGDLALAESLFLIIAIVWVTNLFNFMDGSDGLAGGMAVFGFGTYSAAAWLSGHREIALIGAVIVCATIPFLVVNFHPAKLFMGDSGSVTLGFLAAIVGALGWREGAWSPFFPVFVFSPFIGDASLTLLRRAFQRQKFWQAHQDHYYQKLIRMGYSHRKTALFEYCVFAMSSIAAFASIGLDGTTQLVLLIIWGAVLVTAAAWIDQRWIHYRNTCAE